ncbi:MAG: polyprenyl synthetase family protein [Rickettsiaceae bacterium]|nr:polyprenyl synthetase family protein [Rickettsiaceae bacterium]
MAEIDTLEKEEKVVNRIPDLIKNLHFKYVDEISEINNLIASLIESDEQIITEASLHIINSGGKRIRPILTLLCAELFNIDTASQKHVLLAAATEFIHTATLLHDDVVDASLLRRFNPTVNSIWGNQEAILVGDFLFSASFKLMVRAQSFEALETLAESSRVIAKGEVAQLSTKKQKIFIDEKIYFDIITSKTAELFGAACKVGGIIAGANPYQQELLYKFGLSIGIIYQIKDDMMDYYSNTAEIGKNIGDDFYESKITLPLIYLRNIVSELDRKYIESVMINNDSKSEVELNKIIGLMEKYNIKKLLEETIEKMHQESLVYLDKLESINLDAKSYLRDLASFVSIRLY